MMKIFRILLPTTFPMVIPAFLFIAAVIRRQGIPFDLVLNDEPNAETYKAMDDAENRRNLHGPFKSFEEMMDDINA